VIDDRDDIGHRLRLERPEPRPAWRVQLRRKLAERNPLPARPTHLRLLVAAYGLSGLALLGLAAHAV
jgi:hypothetical protein